MSCPALYLPVTFSSEIVKSFVCQAAHHGVTAVWKLALCGLLLPDSLAFRPCDDLFPPNPLLHTPRELGTQTSVADGKLLGKSQTRIL